MTDNRLTAAIVDLQEVMKRLRQDCPWDRMQTHLSLRRYLVEEACEVLEALDSGDPGALASELGDLLFQVWFHAEVASERTVDGFELADVLEGVAAKLRRRHPHVFGDIRAADAEEVRRNWDRIKREEGRASVLDGIPPELSSLLAAQKIQEKAAGVGFDWPDAKGVLEKIREEICELEAEIDASGDSRDPARIEAEMGDLLFALTNLARHLGFTAEDALRGTNRRFGGRFRHMESAAASLGRSLDSFTIEELEELWQGAKRAEK